MSSTRRQDGTDADPASGGLEHEIAGGVNRVCASVHGDRVAGGDRAAGVDVADNVQLLSRRRRPDADPGVLFDGHYLRRTGAVPDAEPNGRLARGRPAVVLLQGFDDQLFLACDLGLRGNALLRRIAAHQLEELGFTTSSGWRTNISARSSNPRSRCSSKIRRMQSTSQGIERGC